MDVTFYIVYNNQYSRRQKKPTIEIHKDPSNIRPVPRCATEYIESGID